MSGWQKQVTHEVNLARWRIVEIPYNLELDRHVFGQKREGGWRISSPIVEETDLWALTRDGGLYRKGGERLDSLDSEAAAALFYLLRKQGYSPTMSATLVDMARQAADDDRP